MSLADISTLAEERKQYLVLETHASTSVSDKFGNTIARYPAGSEEWPWLQTYGLQFQLGTRKLVDLFMKAFKAGKLSADGVISFLEKSWIGESISRTYSNSDIVNVVPLALIIPGIRYLFSELEKWKVDPNYEPELILAIDSLTTKVEALLRYLCERIGISTFNLKDKGLVMEKNLDEILASLDDKVHKTNFLEEDRRFIKFVLSEKIGSNLRNTVCHGLLDSFEYSIEKVVWVFTIIVRLSKYTFHQKNELP